MASPSPAEALLRFHLVVSGILAHDLKNPVSGVLMNARLLAATEGEDARRLGARIVTSAERMSRMVDQIAEWAKVQGTHAPGANAIPIMREDCDLEAIVEGIVSDFRVRKPGVPITLARSGRLQGRWDIERVSQIASNLVANGLEHATAPGVAVALKGDSPEEVTLSVTNEGAIADPAVPLLFEPFRGRTAGAGLRGRGLGLGLFLTREIVRAHGGRIDVDRTTAGLVTFSVTLARNAP